MKEAKTIFEQITTVEKGNNLAKSKPLESVSVTSKAIFVGNAANWKYKWKDVIKLEVDGTSLYLETQNKTCELVNAEEKTWLNFSQTVLKRWDKLQGKSNIQEETVAAVVSMVKKPRYRSKRVFGTQARRHHRLLASAEANRRIEWSDEEEEEKENHVPSVQEEDDYQSMENDDAIFATSEDEKSLVPPSVKKDRIRRKVVDEDSDEELFDDVPMTIPSISGGRLVTPHNKAVIQDDEDEELFTSTPPPDTASPSREKGQLPVSSFFTKFAAKNSDTNASIVAVTTPKIRVKPSPPAELLTPIQQDNAAWIENTQPSTPTRTPRRVAPPTPAKTPARSPALRDISRHFRPPKRTHDHQDDDIEEFSEDEATSTHKRLRITTSARKRFVNTQPGQYRHGHGTADSVIALASSARRQNPQQLPAPHSSGKSLPPVSRWKGLRNLGNTCYLNSSLQLIYTLRDFCSGLMGHGGDLSRSIMEVAKLMEETTSESVSPRRVKEAVDHLTDRFCGNEQRDAHEFISDIIDRVHDELEEEQKEQKEDTLPKVSAPLLTDAFFRMNVRVCLKCDSCGYERTMDEMYRHLSIEVDRHKKLNQEDEERPKWTVSDGLTRFFRPEQRDIKCEKCDEGRTATQTMSGVSRPKALILHLKRFVVREKPRITRSIHKDEDNKQAEGGVEPAPPVEMIIQKNKDQVLLEPQFDLHTFLPQDGKDSSTYKLSGIIHHHGVTPSSGHYTADGVRDDAGKEAWVSYDDGLASKKLLSKIMKSPISQRTAYMLLYRLED